jgi:hypothetical protein
MLLSEKNNFFGLTDNVQKLEFHMADANSIIDSKSFVADVKLLSPDNRKPREIRNRKV